MLQPRLLWFAAIFGLRAYRQQFATWRTWWSNKVETMRLPERLLHSDKQSSDGRFSCVWWYDQSWSPSQPETHKKNNNQAFVIKTKTSQSVCYLPASSTEGLSSAADSDGSFPHARQTCCEWDNHWCSILMSTLRFVRTLLSSDSPIFTCLTPSNVSHSYTSSLMHNRSCLIHRSAISWSSSVL